MAEAQSLCGPPPGGYALAIRPLPAPTAQARYLERFHVLSEACGIEPHAAATDTE